ncbi:ATP-binding protein [Acidiphilium multivorum]|uniref:ATP-binding protein n=1 Tax=Acidiphilium multivorum TaxID=62140 RepID=UPI0039C9E374
MRAAHFPAVKSLDTLDFTAIPSLNKMLVLDLARCDYINAHDNIITLGNSGTGKTLDGRSPMTACWAPV